MSSIRAHATARYARLDAERHAGLEDAAVAGDDVRLFMVEPDAVTGAMDEELRESGGRKHVSMTASMARRSYRADSLDRGGLRLLEDLHQPVPAATARPEGHTYARSRCSSRRALRPDVDDHGVAGREHPVDSSWWGLAPFGPEATMTKSTVACPAARIASAISAPTSPLRAPWPQESGDLRVYGVDRFPGPHEGRDLAADLRMRKSWITAPARSAAPRAWRRAVPAPSRPTCDRPRPPASHGQQ